MVTNKRLAAIIIALTLALTACSSNDTSGSTAADGAEAADAADAAEGDAATDDSGDDGDTGGGDDGWTGPDPDDDRWPDPADFDLDTEFGPHESGVLDVVEQGFGVHRNQAGTGSGTAAVLLHNPGDEAISGYNAVFIFKDADGTIVGVANHVGRTIDAGERAYLGTMWTALTAQPATLEVHTILAEDSFWSIPGTGIDITVDDVTNGDDRVHVRGTVENTSRSLIKLTVGCALRNAAGEIKGFATNEIQEVEPGETAEWEAEGLVPAETADCTAIAS